MRGRPLPQRSCIGSGAPDPQRRSIHAVLPSLAEANAKVHRLADTAPLYEAVMATDPDFVTASFGRHLKKEGGVATRDRFRDLR
ncbi:hypothetical protein MTP03_18880 [Tsukamurella sp. PLM1]|nr:hypothetical protein MTP03_18880 [Tsukamurella sp. PLM1]